MGYLLQKFKTGQGLTPITPFRTPEEDKEKQKRLKRLREPFIKAGITPPEPKESVSTFQTVLGVLQRGETAPFIASLVRGKSFGEAAKVFAKSAFGKEPERRIVYSDVFTDLGWRPDSTVGNWVKGVAGLAADILLDPTTYLTFGIGGAIKIVSKTGAKVALNKTGTRLLKKNVGQFGEAKARRMMADTVAREGGKKYLASTGLKFAGRQILPRKVVTAPFRAVGKAAQFIPGVKPATGLLKIAFLPFAKIEELPARWGGKESYTGIYRDVIKKTRAEKIRAVGATIELGKKAKLFQGRKFFVLKKPSPGEFIAEALERGEKTGNQIIDDIIEFAGRKHQEIRQAELKRGFTVGDLPDYLRRFLTKEGREFVNAGKDIWTGLSKELKVKLGAARERKIVRIVSEAGVDVSFKRGLINLRPIKTQQVINQLNDAFGKRIDTLQKLQLRLAKPEVTEQLKLLKSYLALLRRNISELPTIKIIKEGVEQFSKEEFDEVIASLVGVEMRKLAPLIKELEDEVLASGGREFLKGGIEAAKRIPREKKIIDIQRRIIEIQNETVDRIRKFEFFDFIDKEGGFYKAVRGKEEFKGFSKLIIKEINEHYQKTHGIKLFEPDFFKAFAGRQAESIQAINMYDFFGDIGRQFGQLPEFFTKTFKHPITGKVTETKVAKSIVEDGVKFVETKVPYLKGVLMPEPIAKHLDETYRTLTNEEATRGFLKLYDAMQRFWKSSVTGIWPAFHARNFMGGMFNNYLAGVKTPLAYIRGHNIARGEQGEIKTRLGTTYTYDEIRRLASDLGVTGQPGMMDVMMTVEEMINRGKIKNISPRMAMEIVEDRLRIPLFVDRLIKGDSPEEARNWVYRFHFDYSPEALTPFENKVMRRLAPFYRWSRGNVPLQIEQLLSQPGKYAALKKIQRNWERDIPTVEEERKYMPEWMGEMYSFRLPIKDKVFYMQLDLPAEDLGKLPLTESGVREIISLFSPILIYGIERIANRKIYFDSDIVDKDLPKDLQTASVLKHLRLLPEPIKKWLNFKEGVKLRDRPNQPKVFEPYFEMDAIKLHAFKTFMGRFYSSFARALEEDMPLWGRLSRLIGGAPVRILDVDEQRYWRGKEEERILLDTASQLKRRGIIPYTQKGYPKPPETETIPDIPIIPGGQAHYLRNKFGAGL